MNFLCLFMWIELLIIIDYVNNIIRNGKFEKIKLIKMAD